MNAPSDSTLHKPGSHLLIASSLVGATLLLFLPVILQPHWGQFDDANLILACGRRLLDDPSFRSFLILSGGTRVGLFLWTTALWPFFADNPAAYYTVNFVVFSLTLILFYLMSLKLTSNRCVSACSSALILTAAGLFEVIYTLDKQELYLPCLFSVVVLSHLIALDCKKRTLAAAFALTLFCSIASYYTKECGAILCLFSVLFLASTMIASPRANRLQAGIRIGILSLLTVVPYLCIHGLSSPTNGYIQLTFSVATLSKKVANLFFADPVFVLLLLFVLASWIRLTLSRHFSKSTLDWSALTALVASTWAASLALLCYDTGESILLYIWLPVYVFLIPAVASSIQNLSNLSPQVLNAKTIFGIIFAIAIVQLPARVVQSQFQFQMDALLGSLADSLASYARESKTRILAAAAVFDVSSNEVPENIETFVRSKLESNYYDKKDERTGQYKFSMLNFLSDQQQPAHLESDPPEIFRMREFRGSKLEYKTEFPVQYVGWSGFQILAGSTGYGRWVRRPFTTGDLLIVPYGDLQPNAVLYRGCGMFANPWQTQLWRFAQLTLDEIGYVERKIVVLGGHRITIGWRILRVTASQPLSANLTSTGNLNGQPIYYRFESTMPTLRITAYHKIVRPLAATFSDQSSVSMPAPNSFTFSLPLRPGNTSEQPAWVKFSDSDTLRIKQMELQAN